MEESATPSTQRLFVGVSLPSPVVDRLAALAGGIPRARWEGHDKLHITVRFIGDVDGDTQRRIEEALDTVAHPPFSVAVSGVGFFPPKDNPRILWAGLDGAESLRELNRRVERALSGVGLHPENRRYEPHITLARLRDSPRDKVRAFVEQNAPLRTDTFEVKEFLLYSSVLAPSGSTYRVERRFSLKSH